VTTCNLQASASATLLCRHATSYME